MILFISLFACAQEANKCSYEGDKKCDKKECASSGTCDKTKCTDNKKCDKKSKTQCSSVAVKPD